MRKIVARKNLLKQASRNERCNQRIHAAQSRRIGERIIIRRDRQLKPGNDPGERTFGPLIHVEPVRVQPIAAAAGFGIEQADAEFVVAGEPTDRGPSLVEPARFAGDAVRLDARFDKRHRFDGLLVKSSPPPVAVQPTFVADQANRAAVIDLQLDEPFE